MLLSILFLDEALRPVYVSSIKCDESFSAYYVYIVMLHYVAFDFMPDGSAWLSDVFGISRGVLQGDMFSPAAFTMANIFLSMILRMMVCAFGRPPYQVDISGHEYADGAGLLDDDTGQSSTRVSAILLGSKRDAAMPVPIPKSKAMHIYPKNRVSCTTYLRERDHNLVA